MLYDNMHGTRIEWWKYKPTIRKKKVENRTNSSATAVHLCHDWEEENEKQGTPLKNKIFTYFRLEPSPMMCITLHCIHSPSAPFCFGNLKATWDPMCSMVLFPSFGTDILLPVFERWAGLSADIASFRFRLMVPSREANDRWWTRVERRSSQSKILLFCLLGAIASRITSSSIRRCWLWSQHTTTASEALFSSFP